MRKAIVTIVIGERYRTFWLDPRFNMIVAQEIADSFLFSIYELTERLPKKARRYLLAALRRAEPLSTRLVIRRLFRKNYFIHFASCPDLATQAPSQHEISAAL